MSQTYLPQIKIPATYMRGGTSKGVFFNLADLPEDCQLPGKNRDEILLRVIGSPDPYGKQTDGMGGATSSTSKAVIVAKSTQQNHDVDYLFGQVAIDKAFVDWSGNCGNLTAAVGSFAIMAGLVPASKVPLNGLCEVNIWQKNIGKTIIAKVPITHGQVQETGGFELDGVTFPAAEVVVEFMTPVDTSGDLFPTGNLIDTLEVPGVGCLQATMITAGIPTIFVNAKELGFEGTELQSNINENAQILTKFENIRAHGALKMGLINNIDEAKHRQHTPKVAFIADSKTYISASGKNIYADDIDLNVRAFSMGKLHHAMMGTAAVAIAAAGSIPGTLVHTAANAQRVNNDESFSTFNGITFGHPSGTLKVAAETLKVHNQWVVNKVIMSRSARVLMEGWIRVPNKVEAG